MSFEIFLLSVKKLTFLKGDSDEHHIDCDEPSPSVLHHSWLSSNNNEKGSALQYQSINNYQLTIDPSEESNQTAVKNPDWIRGGEISVQSGN